MKATEDIARYSTNKEDIARYYKIFSRSFKVGWMSFAIAVIIEIVMTIFQLKDIWFLSMSLATLGLALMISWLYFHVYLGMLAKNLGKSWITWVGLSSVTFPYGPLVAYNKMKKLNEEMRQHVAVVESYRL